MIMKLTQPSIATLTRRALPAAFALAAGLFVAGCVVSSVYPYYHAKDVIFDPALLGVWSEPAKTSADMETWTFEKLDDRTYKLTTADGDKKTEFDTRLFKLGDQRFLDCLPRERHDNTAPVHYLMRLDSVTAKLTIRLLDYDWLGKLVEKSPRAIRHVIVPKKAGESDGGDLLLTADTRELQSFIRKHLKTADAWSDEVTMTRH